MNEDKILAALTQLQSGMNQMQADIEALKKGQDETNARLDKVDSRLDKVEQELATVKADVRNVNVIIETEVTRNIRLIAEGQTGLFDKVAPLPDAVDKLRIDMRTVKSVLTDHSASIRELSLA